jgi:integration host factor subunit alpha
LNPHARKIITLTKTDLLEKISNDGLPKNEASEVLEGLLEIMKKTVEAGEDVMISGFGKFCVKEKKKRRGRNPATGEELYLDARRVVTFQNSGVLRDKVNGEG